ncbi:MAG: ATP-binding protein [Eubacterium sp.]|nr:ATP-binding protein [Eubacterium sp.]
MGQNDKKNKMFQSAHLMLLIGNTVMSAMLMFETIRVGWEKWAAVMIAFGILVSWALYIRQTSTPSVRMWIYGIIIVITFFFYGVHDTSRFDMIAIIAAVIILFTMAGIRGLITMAQITYYVTMGYNLFDYFWNGGKVDGLLISRIVLHTVVLTMIAWFGRTIIAKWSLVLSEIGEEVDELSETTRRLDDFLVNASHEIRTPVNAVVGLSGVCMNRGINEENRDDLLAIRTAGRRVADQMSDILDYTEIDRDMLVINDENYMMSSLLSDVVAKLRPYLAGRVELILDVEASIPAMMNSDVAKLKKILWHLIMNGLKYTNEGGVYVKITSEEQDYGVNLCIDVSDTGIGMSEDEIEQVFDQFYQVDSSRSRVQGGLGLGMHIVSGFVRAMGGFLTVKSKPGIGTDIHVCIPQKVIDASSCIYVNERENVSLGAFFMFKKYPIPAVREYYNSLITNIVKGMGVKIHGVDSMDNLKKLMDSGVYISHMFIGMKEYELDPDYIETIAAKIPVYLTADIGYSLPKRSKVRFFEKPLYCFPVISVINASWTEEDKNCKMDLHGVHALVVDDEPMNLIVANSVFTGYGMTVETANSGPEAIDMCVKNKYDIVFMDHMMPGMDGVETMKRIRSGMRGKADMAIVALTANTVSTAREMFMQEGFDGFIGKPIEVTELERTLKLVLPEGKIAYVPFEDEEVEPAAVESKTEAGPEPAPSRDPISIKIVSSNTEPEPEPEEPQTKGREALESLRVYGLDAEVGLQYCQGDESLYQAILTDFANGAPEMITYLDEKMDNEDMKGYEIKIHSMKSTSRMVGALEIGDIAERLEKASAEGRVEDVKLEHNQVITLYSCLTEAIRNFYRG